MLPINEIDDTLNDMKNIYPVTIFRSRYSGAYEGAEWLAINEDPRDDIFDEIFGDDGSCMDFFNFKGDRTNHFTEPLCIGHGDNPKEAYDDLLKIAKEKGIKTS